MPVCLILGVYGQEDKEVSLCYRRACLKTDEENIREQQLQMVLHTTVSTTFLYFLNFINKKIKDYLTKEGL